MSFTITDTGSPNNEVRTSVWNWKPTLEIIRDIGAVDEPRLKQMQYNATGTSVSQDEAQMIGAGVRGKYLSKLAPNQRIRLDLSITDEPDDGTFYSGDDKEAWKNYGATYAWLEEFAAFCLNCKGFQVF